MAKIFDKLNRFRVPISEIGRPEHRNLYGDDYWGEDTYHADYAGLAQLVKPQRILEMGVYLGYSACAMMLGAYASCQPREYVGIDAEVEEAESNMLAIANINFLVNHRVPCRLMKADLMNDHVESYGLGVFDLINVDAVHTERGTNLTCQLAWRLLRPGGVMVVDDARDLPVWDGFHGFLKGLLAVDICFTTQSYDSPRGWFLVRKEA